MRSTVEPITESDAAIEAALADAHVPALMAALVHLTGDSSHLEGLECVYDFFGDGQGGGLPEDVQTAMKARALDVLGALRDGAPGRPEAAADLSRETVRQMMDFIAGQPIPERYVSFLMEELHLDGAGADDRVREGDLSTKAAKRDFQVIVIGAGMSGVLAAIRLQEAGVPYVVVDKNEEVGGTWYENTYPGCRVDSPNHIYSYSFDPKPDWPQHYSTQQVLFDYFKECADRYDVRKNIRFGTEVIEAVFDESSSAWRVLVRDRDGTEETLVANAVISAVGQLNRPRFPDVPGRESFAGPSFHSASWDHALDLTGKRVAVIGTGASAFQFVPEIAARTSELLVFQRSAPWLAPTPNYHDDVEPGMQWLLRHVPYFEKWYRFWLFWMMTDGILPAVTGDPEWDGGEQAVSEMNDELRQMLTEIMRGQLLDRPDLLEKVVPEYPPGGKRMLRDNGVWFEALKRDDVRLLTDPIREITPTGIVTADGAEHAVDVIIYGTGFQASRFLWPMKIQGRGGVTLNDRWGGDARAYLGITVPGFPNLFCMYGPNTNIVVNGSIIFFSECEIRYIVGCLDLLLSGGHATLDCKEDVHDRFNERIDSANSTMAWGAPQVSSWYKNAKGRVSQNWPLALVDYWERTQAPDRSDFDIG